MLPGLAYTLQSQGMVRYLEGGPDEALTLFRRALALRRKFHGATSLEVAESQFAIGKVLLEQGQRRAAEPHLQEAAAIRAAVLPAADSSLAEAEAALAEARGQAVHAP